MMPRSIFDHAPDGFNGAIMAVEGIRGAAVLLNGPTGCKFYHAAISDGQLPRQTSIDPLRYDETFYFGQPRVPATYLDSHDYIFGATEKLEKILPAVAAKGHRLIAVVNSPGAALIGDDLKRCITAAGLAVPCLALESTGYSNRFSLGFQEAVVQVLEQLAPPRPLAPTKRVVNLIGLSIFHRHWEGDALELTRLLDLCGIRVNAIVCAGCRVEDLQILASAEANLVVHAEYADHLAPFMASGLGIPALAPILGAPIGFTQTERWLRGVCEALHTDAAPALSDLRQSRRRAYDTLSRFNGLTGLPRGATFALCADGSSALSLVQWLYTYLGMVPVAVIIQETTPACAEALRKALKGAGCEGALDADINAVHPDLVFGDEGFISRFRTRKRPVAGIHIALPDTGGLKLLPRCHLGGNGALWLLEPILNGLWTSC
jgi:nitrogenase molybdenum-iron protein alpha/beta subunit